MSEKQRISTELDFSVLGLREINRATDLITKLESKVPLTAKELDSLHKILAKVSGGMQALAAATGSADKAAMGNLRTIMAQEKTYRSYASAIQVAAQAERDRAKSQAAAYSTYKPNIDAGVGIDKERERAAKESLTSAQKYNRQLIQNEEQTRAAELASLRGRIQERATIQAQWRGEELKGVQRVNAQFLKSETETRAAELAGLRSSILERNRLQEQSSKAQLSYTAQARRNGVRYGEEVGDSLITQRYALYDVAQTWGMVAAATLGAVAAAGTVAIAYEKNFASVQRTTGLTGEKFGELREQIVEMSTELPTTVADLAQIATLGGQLGIEAQGIDEFTRVVAQLTSTTDLSAQAAGTALGRFQALLDVPSGEFENLASSILKVGVNSVATETQIVNTATQISSMGQFAGLTADQVIGLAGALASVGAQPELSRGTITRTFNLMSKAVAQGGDELTTFARLSGTSADEFRNAWGTERFGAVFQNFLSGVQQEGDKAVSTLNDLGITSSRDVPLLLRLAGATDVVNNAFKDAASGYADGTELAEQYGIVAETVAAKLTMLLNTVKAIADAVGSETTGPLSAFLDVLLGIGNAFLQVAQNPVGQWILGIAAALMTVIGLFATFRAAQALMIASWYALRTAEESVAAAGTRANTVLSGLTRTMFAMAVGTKTAEASTKAYTTSLQAGTGKMAAFGVAAKAAGASAVAAGSAARAALVSTGWGVAIAVAIAGLAALANEHGRVKREAEALTVTLDAQTGAITQNTRTHVANTLEKAGVLQASRELGLSLSVVTDAALGEAAAMDKVREAVRAAREEDEAASNGQIDYTRGIVERADAANKVERAVMAQADAVAMGRDQWERMDEAVGGMGDVADEVGGALSEIETEIRELVDAEYSMVGGTVAVQNALYGLGQSLYENGTSFDAFSVGGRANLEALQSTISAMVQAAAGDSTALATMLAGLMDALASYGVNAASQLGFVQNMLNSLVGGQGGVSGLTGVKDAAGQAGNALKQGFSAGAFQAAKSANKAGSSASKAAKEIRTLSDYVKDLQTVFKSSFEIRFGLDQSVDAVADAYQDLIDNSRDAAEAVDEARQAVVEADAEIKGLTAGRKTLEYQLKVAEEYGDVLRVAEITAELAENNADLTKAQRDRRKAATDLTKAEEENTKSLSGSTEGSRNQRDMVLNLIGAYQDQVAALANSGLSQDEVARRTAALRAEFVAQLTQLGYNRDEVNRYAAAFDDLTYAIKNVPRNITVSADTNPAQRALDEFLAKARTSSANTNIGLNVPTGASTYGMGYDAGNAYATGWNAAVAVQRRLIVQTDAGLPGGKRYSVDGGKTWFLQRGGSVGSGVQYHSTGGVHGMHPGSPRGTDTTPAWLTPGEYVIQKSAVEKFGLPFMNAINNHQTPVYRQAGGGTGGGSRMPSAMMIELSPTDRALLAAAGNVVLTVDGRVLARTVNGANTNAAVRGAN